MRPLSELSSRLFFAVLDPDTYSSVVTLATSGDVLLRLGRFNKGKIGTTLVIVWFEGARAW